MPGRNDWSGGFTKSANKTKFVRKRDVKMKDSELRKEEHICKVMCEGICNHCREKVQWRFRYDKYKPLKNIGNCQSCKQKAVKKAYRTFCDPCASKRKVCPGCCIDLEEANKPRGEAAIAKAKAAEEAAAAAMDEEDDEGEEEGEMGEPVEVKASDEMEEDGEGDEEEDGDEDEEEDEEDEEEGEKDEPDSVGETVFDVAAMAEFNAASDHIKVSEIAWHQKKFSNVAASKYSKNRVVGKEK
jgi:hypothetical protein